MGAGQFQKDAAGTFLDGIQIGADALALLVALGRDLLFVGDDAHGAAHVDEYGAAFDALDGAGDDLALFLAVFSEDRSLFSLADLLDDDLLCSLGGDASVVAFDFEGKDDLVANSSVFLDPFRVCEKDVMFGVVADLDIGLVHVLEVLGVLLVLHDDAVAVDDDLDLKEFRLACVRVEDATDDLAFLAVFFFIGSGKGELDRFEHLRFWNAALFFELAED